METDANSTFLQIGIGGIFAVMLIRMVLDFLSKHEEKKKFELDGLAGEKSVDFWENKFRNVVQEVIDNSMGRLITEMHELREDTKKIRETGHKQIELLQQISGKFDWLRKENGFR